MEKREGGARRYRVRLWYARACLVVLLTVGVFSFDRYTAPPDAAKDCAVQVSPVSADRDIPVPTAAYPGQLSQTGGSVNDASCLNRTPVYGVVRPHGDADIQEALAFARTQGLSVAVSGTRHSMGGQAAFPGALVIDMRSMDQVNIDEAKGTVRVGAGATWQHVLETLHERNLSVAAMPSIDVLSVGGTVSVNAHGADFRIGSLASTVRSLRVMLADGTIRDLSRDNDPELFRAVVGGYGLFGVILQVELETVDNVMYDFRQRTVRTAEFTDFFENEVVADQDNRMMFAHLSTSPSSLMDEAIVYTYSSTTGESDAIPPLKQEQDSRMGRLALNLARHSGVAQRLKWAGQKHLLPHLRSCRESRNEALRAAEACLVSRNQAMYNDLGLLNNKLPQYTDILQEYFVPAEELARFTATVKDALREHDTVLLSASIRSVNEGETMLNYAPEARLSVVLYLSQKVSTAGNQDMESLTKELVAASLERGGTFYLPYQQHYTRDELTRGYPQLDEFFALKRARDPQLMFMNSFYSRYADPA